MRQLRLRFRRPTTELPGSCWAIAECRPAAVPQQLRFAVFEVDGRGRLQRRPGCGIAYTKTLESAQQQLPAGLLCVTGIEAQRLVRLPAEFARVVEVWF